MRSKKCRQRIVVWRMSSTRGLCTKSVKQLRHEATRRKIQGRSKLRTRRQLCKALGYQKPAGTKSACPNLSVTQLRRLAKERKVKGHSKLKNKRALCTAVLANANRIQQKSKHEMDVLKQWGLPSWNTEQFDVKALHGEWYQMIRMSEAAYEKDYKRDFEALKRLSRYPQCHKFIPCLVQVKRTVVGVSGRETPMIEIWLTHAVGDSLSDIITWGETKSDAAYFAKVQAVFKQLVEGVQFLHAHGIALLRISKYTGAYISNDGRVRVRYPVYGGDAKIAGNSHIPPSLQKYDKPDQLTLKQKKAADVYAIAMTMLELILRGESAIQVEGKIGLKYIAQWEGLKEPYSAAAVYEDLQNMMPKQFHPFAKLIAAMVAERIRTMTTVKKLAARLR